MDWLECKPCGETFTTEQEERKHLEKVHQALAVYCTWCPAGENGEPKELSRAQAFQAHVDKFHPASKGVLTMTKAGTFGLAVNPALLRASTGAPLWSDLPRWQQLGSDVIYLFIYLKFFQVKCPSCRPDLPSPFRIDVG